MMSKNPGFASGQRKRSESAASADKQESNNSVVEAGSASGTHEAPSEPPRRARQGASASANRDNASKGPKNFEFVLVTDSESRRQVRRHAMRQYVHQRRMDGIARLESSRVPVGGWVKGKAENEQDPASKAEELGSDSKSQDINNAAGDCDLDNVEGADTNTYPNDGSFGSKLALALQRRTADPKANPSSPASDPFNSYPVSLTQADHNLINHFVNTYPLMMYKMDDPSRPNPIRTIFHQFALDNKVSFQAMLAVAAKHRAGVEGQTDTVQSLTHKMRALRLINEHLESDVWGRRDGMLYAVSSMAVIEKWSKDESVESMHSQGVRHLIRKRGGMKGVKATGPFIENVMYWVDFSCASTAIYGASLPWTGEVPDESPSTLSFLAPPLHIPSILDPSAGPYDQNTVEIMQSCEDFLSFFRSLKALQVSRLAKPPPLSDDTGIPDEANLFGSSSPLYATLTSLPDYDHGIRDIRFIDEYTSMACLLYLSVALYDHYLTPRDFNPYLRWVNLELQKSTSTQNPSIASLLWIFLTKGGFAAFEESDEGERSWFVSRMLRVAKRLEWTRAGTIWDGLRSALFQLLANQQKCEFGRPQISAAALTARENLLQQPTPVLWDEAEMRQNILGQLYGGPPVFLPSSTWDSAPSIYELSG